MSLKRPSQRIVPSQIVSTWIAAPASLFRLTSRHSADERVDKSDLGKHIEVSANRDQLYGKECDYGMKRRTVVR
jgi:hypothetical protein